MNGLSTFPFLLLVAGASNLLVRPISSIDTTPDSYAKTSGGDGTMEVAVDLADLDRSLFLIYTTDGLSEPEKVCLFMPKGNVRVNSLSVGRTAVWKRGDHDRLGYILTAKLGPTSKLTQVRIHDGDKTRYYNILHLPPSFTNTSTTTTTTTSSSSGGETSDEDTATVVSSATTTTGTDLDYLGLMSYHRELKYPFVDPESALTGLELNIDDDFDRLYFNYSFRWRGNLIYQKWEPNDGEIFSSFRDVLKDYCNGLSAATEQVIEAGKTFKTAELFNIKFQRQLLRLVSTENESTFFEYSHQRNAWAASSDECFQAEYLGAGFQPLILDADDAEEVAIQRQPDIDITRKNGHLLYTRSNIDTFKVIRMVPKVAVTGENLRFKGIYFRNITSQVLSLDLTKGRSNYYLEFLLRDKEGGRHSMAYVRGHRLEEELEVEWEPLEVEDFYDQVQQEIRENSGPNHHSIIDITNRTTTPSTITASNRAGADSGTTTSATTGSSGPDDPNNYSLVGTTTTISGTTNRYSQLVGGVGKSVAQLTGLDLFTASSTDTVTRPTAITTTAGTTRNEGRDVHSRIVGARRPFPAPTSCTFSHDNDENDEDNENDANDEAMEVQDRASEGGQEEDDEASMKSDDSTDSSSTTTTTSSSSSGTGGNRTETTGLDDFTSWPDEAGEQLPPRGQSTTPKGPTSTSTTSSTTTSSSSGSNGSRGVNGRHRAKEKRGVRVNNTTKISVRRANAMVKSSSKGKFRSKGGDVTGEFKNKVTVGTGPGKSSHAPQTTTASDSPTGSGTEGGELDKGDGIKPPFRTENSNNCRGSCRTPVEDVTADAGGSLGEMDDSEYGLSIGDMDGGKGDTRESSFLTLSLPPLLLTAIPPLVQVLAN